MSNTMILLYLVFIKILLNSLKISILQNIYATKPFELLKCNLHLVPSNSFILADKGYQGIYAVYPNSLLPCKAKKACVLDPVLRTYNREIHKIRIGIEHVFGILKTFKILAECYRNRGKRFGLRFNSIAGIYNLELSEK